MIVSWGMVALGLVILLLAGDLLVKGAVNLALRLGIPALIVSLTIVAFGTSAPELLISIDAVLDRQSGLAVGNVVGSNIANVLLVLGVPALISTLDTRDCDTRKSFAYMIAGSFLFIGLAYTAPLVWWHGLILLGALSFILLDQAREARAHRKSAQAAGAAAAAAADDDEEEEVEGADPELPKWRIGLYLVLGIIGLPLGADLLVDGATHIAKKFGVSDAAIGLTLVAIGTSLPELATTVVAAIRKQADVALGNVIGSNMFNLLAIMGVTALVAPIEVAGAFFHLDFWIMIAASLILIPFVFFRQMLGRIWGAIFVVLYGVYLVSVLA
ncbi:MAG: calcium/sodium antiporter [Pseudomonadota bacterium]